MTEAEYQELRGRAQKLLQALRDFPAHELSAFAEVHHPEDKPFTLRVWAVQLESE